ncbi:putative HECT E3 ubiquitin ligase [Phytophthora cinnamomi]|uniref:putative HECT E3 ubiquitin ligase n=1 Tax=Phytophthora cinnamomi TaxID=4785 RepID=UPI00355A8C1E|nr:putative HECT E3 ubiquitin ligase [Phytophthora cinnamomi]
MSSQSSDVESVVSAVKWVGIVLAVAAVVAVATVIYMCCYRKDDASTRTELMDGLLRRDQLEETELEDEGKGWQCVVCGHANGAKRKACLMCGTGIGFLMGGELGRRKSSRMLLRNNSRGITGADVAGGAGEEEDIEALRARQRALFKRRMNTMARKNLSQRQRGAFRRRLWQRKQLTDGKFHWVRQNSTDVVDPVPEGDAALPTLPPTSENTMVAGPNGESVTDYHNLRSQGFVSMYDASGRLTWTKADEVSIDMESFNAMRKGLEQLDFEGVMALGFRMKKQWFLVQLSRIATPVTEAVAKLTVTRERIIQQTLQLVEAAPDALHAYLKITFEGEPGIDAGGLLREWFGIVCKQIFSEKMGLFVPTKGEDMSYWIDPLSGEKNENHLKLFRLAGILVGKALFEGLVLDVHLALPLLKHVLGIPISFSDLEFLDEELHRNCKWLRSNNHVEVLCLTFSVMLENGTEVDLKENGRNIDVTDENKEEYLRLVLEHRMLDSIADQLQEFLMGIYDVVPKALLSVFDYQELELILCGIPTIDTSDWRANTHVRYIKPEENKKNKITEEEQNGVLAWFWIVVEGLAPEERARLLQFVTGTSRVPVEGFRGLMSSSGIIHQFTIQLVPRGKEKSDLFPKAHTCFNRLDLPMYRNMEELETYLTMVSQMEVFGFGLE